MTSPPNNGRSLRRLVKDDGYVVALVALLLLPLLAFTGFAVDLGSWYAQATKIQRAADAAALAGVQDLPILGAATATAQSVAAQNGFVNGVNGVTVTVTQVPDPSAKLRVNIAVTNVGQYFTTPFRSNVAIERSGTAQFLKPVSMGSPKNFLGTGGLAMQGASPFRENYWLAASGPCASKENGDRISTTSDANFFPTAPTFRCGVPPAVANPEYDPNGYFYAVEFKQDIVGSVGVDIYDAALCNNTDGPLDPGDTTGNPFTTTYQMRDNTSFTPTATGLLGAAQSYTTAAGCQTWTRLYTLNNPTKGVYFVQVRTSSGTTVRHNSNGFALRAGDPTTWTACSADPNETSGGAIPVRADCPQVYGYANLGVFANLTGTAAQFYLAQIGPDYNNKQMELALWDPGEGSVAMQILDPNDNPVDFNWEVRCYSGLPAPCTDGSVPPTGGWTGTSGSVTLARGPSAGSSVPQAIDLWGLPAFPSVAAAANPQPGPNRLSPSKFNDRLLKLTVQLPADINAAFGGRQWYKIKYYVGDQPTDRTTWSVNITGAPVRLIPNP